MRGCYYYQFMILRSGRIIKMGSGDEAASAVVTHTVTNYKSGIEPFVGRVQGELKQSVEVFIDSIDNHLATKRIINPTEQFIEAKAHLNLSQGDLGECTRSIFFRDCKTWEDLKFFLRATYGSSEENDAVLDLRRVLKLHDRGSNSFVSQNARINDAVQEFLNNLGKSGWTDLNSKRGISLSNLGRLLQLAVGLHSLPDALVNSFDITFNNVSTEKDVMGQIHKHIGKMPVPDSTILKGSSKDVGTVAAVTNQQHSSNSGNSSNNNSRNYQNSSGGGSHQRRQLRCFNCNREGHVKQNCNVKYCGFHQSATHSFRECKVLNGDANSRSSRNRSRSVNRRYRNQSSNRYNRNTNSPQQSSPPPKTNFQKNQAKGGKG